MPDNEKTPKDVFVEGQTARATFTANPATVIAEIDKLALLLEETKKIAVDTQKGVKGTTTGITWTKRGVIATIVLSIIAIGLSTANILLYLKVI